MAVVCGMAVDTATAIAVDVRRVARQLRCQLHYVRQRQNNAEVGKRRMMPYNGVDYCLADIVILRQMATSERHRSRTLLKQRGN